MKKNYLSKQYNYNQVAGTFSSKEENGLISKAIKLPNYLIVDNSSLVFYQNENNEQLFLNQELSNSPKIFSLDSVKKDNHTLLLNQNQTNFEKEISTKWVIEIDVKSILTLYIFSLIKYYRGFEGIKNINTKQSSVDKLILEYINVNVLKQYVLDTFSLYVKENNLNLESGLIGANIFNPSLVKGSDILKNDINIDFNTDKSIMYVSFNQINPYKTYNFEYYFDFEMIKNKEVIRLGSDFLTGRIEQRSEVVPISLNDLKLMFDRLDNKYLVPLEYNKINDYSYVCSISPYKYSIVKDKSTIYRLILKKREIVLFDHKDRSLNVLVDKLNMYFEGNLKGI